MGIKISSSGLKCPKMPKRDITVVYLVPLNSFKLQ